MQSLHNVSLEASQAMRAAPGDPRGDEISVRLCWQPSVELGFGFDFRVFLHLSFAMGKNGFQRRCFCYEKK